MQAPVIPFPAGSAPPAAPSSRARPCPFRRRRSRAGPGAEGTPPEAKTSGALSSSPRRQEAARRHPSSRRPLRFPAGARRRPQPSEPGFRSPASDPGEGQSRVPAGHGCVLHPHLHPVSGAVPGLSRPCRQSCRSRGRPDCPRLPFPAAGQPDARLPAGFPGVRGFAVSQASCRHAGKRDRREAMLSGRGSDAAAPRSDLAPQEDAFSACPVRCRSAARSLAIRGAVWGPPHRSPAPGQGLRPAAAGKQG